MIELFLIFLPIQNLDHFYPDKLHNFKELKLKLTTVSILVNVYNE